MRLSKIHIEGLSNSIYESLVKNGAIESINPSRTRDGIEAIITKDMETERMIEEEARQILLQYQKELSDNMEFHTLLLKVKAKIAKERGFIL